MSAEEKALEREAKRGMNDDEATFAVESNIDSHSYEWSDKYRWGIENWRNICSEHLLLVEYHFGLYSQFFDNSW